jgi:uncharacterized YccA/Bax inhibitor family protein
MIRTSNPALNAGTFDGLPGAAAAEAMTIGGTVNKSFVLLALMLVSAMYIWNMFYANFNAEGAGVVADKFLKLLIAGSIGSLALALITVFFKKASPVTAPLYALLEGLLIGSVSAFFELRFHGIVLQAVALTFGTMFCLLAAYRSGLVKATENLKLGVVAATGAVFIIYMLTWILRCFHRDIPYIHQSGPIGIGFSVIVIIIAALNLVLDFDFIENGARAGAPKYMEWYAAFGLMVTLVWLYFEILNLLGKIRNR